MSANENFGKKETMRRFNAAIKGAFVTRPMPLKNKAKRKIGHPKKKSGQRPAKI